MIDFWSHLGVVRRQRVAPEKVPTNAAALKEFRSSNYDEVSDANQITYYYFSETERTLPAHRQKSSGY
jgi:hypothetical protein